MNKILVIFTDKMFIPTFYWMWKNVTPFRKWVQLVFQGEIDLGVKIDEYRDDYAALRMISHLGRVRTDYRTLSYILARWGIERNNAIDLYNIRFTEFGTHAPLPKDNKEFRKYSEEVGFDYKYI